MKELFDNIVKLLPQPLVIATVLAACAFFAIYFNSHNRSYPDTFRDSTFRTISVLLFAAALLYLIHAPHTAQESLQSKPVLLVPQFANDNEDTYRQPLISDITARLDATLSRSGTVGRVRAFVRNPQAARETMELYGASAILFDTSISHINDQHIVCLSLLSRGSQATACFPPFQITDRAKHIDNLVTEIAGRAATSDPTNANPLIKRMVDLETQVNRLASLVEARKLPVSSVPYPIYRKRYALIVGINKVASLPTRLSGARSDAESIGRLLREKYDFNTKELLDEVATKKEILGALQAISGEASKEDAFVFFFSGNGSFAPAGDTPDGMIATLCSHDFTFDSPFTTREVLTAIDAIKASHKAVIVDACHATAGLVGKVSLGPSEDASAPVTTFLCACRGEETSSETDKGGVLSQALIRALGRDADLQDGPVWMRNIFLSIQAQTAKSGVRQTPQLLTLSGSGEIAWSPATR